MYYVSILCVFWGSQELMNAGRRPAQIRAALTTEHLAVMLASRKVIKKRAAGGLEGELRENVY